MTLNVGCTRELLAPVKRRPHSPRAAVSEKEATTPSAKTDRKGHDSDPPLRRPPQGGPRGGQSPSGQKGRTLRLGLSAPFLVAALGFGCKCCFPASSIPLLPPLAPCDSYLLPPSSVPLPSLLSPFPPSPTPLASFPTPPSCLSLRDTRCPTPGFPLPTLCLSTLNSLSLRLSPFFLSGSLPAALPPPQPLSLLLSLLSPPSRTSVPILPSSPLPISFPFPFPPSLPLPPLFSPSGSPPSPQANVCYFICLERAYLFSDVWPPGRRL